MATFNFPLSYSANLSVKPRVRTASFSDGYEQRVADGINTKLRVWSVNFNGDAATINPIEAFLDDKGGVTSFDWTPPTGIAGKWLCSEWNRSIEDYNNESLSASFKEVIGE